MVHFVAVINHTHAGAEFISHYDIWVHSEDPDCGESDMVSIHYGAVLGTTTMFMLTASNDTSNYLKIGCTYMYSVS